MDDIAYPDFDYEAVFEVEDYLHFYRGVLPEEFTSAQVEFLVRQLELGAGQDILDLACGHGRHANRLAALGMHVTGVDYTPGFLELAREEAERMSVQVRYLQGDMRSIEFQEEFDRVLLLFTAFGYFDDSVNQQVMRNVANALRPGGLLCFDIPNRDAYCRHYLPYIVMEVEGDLLIDRHAFDLATGRLYNRRIVIRDGVRRDKPFFVRLYNYTEIHSLLEGVGLQIEQVYGGWNDDPLDTESRRMVIIARKAYGA
jgi:SAM-dependent methyltransferase